MGTSFAKLPTIHKMTGKEERAQAPTCNAVHFFQCSVPIYAWWCFWIHPIATYGLLHAKELDEWHMDAIRRLLGAIDSGRVISPEDLVQQQLVSWARAPTTPRRRPASCNPGAALRYGAPFQLPAF